MMAKSDLYVYGTVFNNADRIKQCIESIKPLKPKRIFVIDNFSTDGTYELLQKMENVVVKQARCSRGEGRELAMKLALGEAKPHDALMHIDFDSVYTEKYRKYTMNCMRHLEARRYYLIGGLSCAAANRALEWRNLNYGEDMERWARAKRLGYDLVLPPRDWMKPKEYFDNMEHISMRDRERRYAHGLGRMRRLFGSLVDTQRGYAFKSFGDYWRHSKQRGSVVVVYFLAYYAAALSGVYSHNKTLSNEDYVFERG